MGHESVQITLDTYGHLIVDSEKDAKITTALEARLFGQWQHGCNISSHLLHGVIVHGIDEASAVVFSSRSDWMELLPSPD